MGNLFSCCMPYNEPNIPKALDETHPKGKWNDTRPPALRAHRVPTPFQRVEYSFNGRRWSPYEDDEVPDFIR